MYKRQYQIDTYFHGWQEILCILALLFGVTPSKGKARVYHISFFVIFQNKEISVVYVLSLIESKQMKKNNHRKMLQTLSYSFNTNGSKNIFIIFTCFETHSLIISSPDNFGFLKVKGASISQLKTSSVQSKYSQH